MSEKVASELKSDTQERLKYSSSVNGALKEFKKDKQISATDLAQELYKRHPEYANGLKIPKLKTTDQRKTGIEWLKQVESLFDPTENPELNSRRVIIGLCLLEHSLASQLKTAQLFDLLVNGLGKTLTDIMTDVGREEWKGLNKHLSESTVSVPIWEDNPLENLEDDLLGRVAFSRYLVKRIANIPTESKTYVMLLYGPWGSGKSTLLNFISAELKKKELTSDDWLVVKYNAWREQHVQPPWWSLMNSVFQGTKKELGWKNQISEYWWRFKTGRILYLIISIIIALIILLVPYLISDQIKQNPTLSGINSLSSLATMAGNLSKIIAPLTVFWGVIQTANDSLLSGSTQAAKRYSELANDPTDKIKNHFEKLIKQLNARKKRVIIFIDDLDRCHSSYVVELLECIQTLYREISVVFMVVADRRWLDACYENVYTMKNSCVLEPGKTLGCLFLEKAFRFSAPIPRIPDGLKERYWLYLLDVAPLERKANLDSFKNEAKNKVSKLKSEEEVRKLVDNSRKKQSDDKQYFIKQRLIREEAAVKLASPDIIERLEHDLKPYSELLNPNPRSMKLLVNAYSLNSALAILSEEEIEFHQLVLWTILSSRWPQLAIYLEEFPEMLYKIKIDQEDVIDIPDNLKPLFSDKEVKKIVQGEIQGKGPLIFETVVKCSRLHA